MKIKKEICYYWPLWFSLLLTKQQQKKLIKILPKVQISQAYLWRALNIYDDLIDGDTKPRQKLLEATSYYRRFLMNHYQLGLADNYYSFLNKLLILWEKENKKEIIRHQQSWLKQKNYFRKNNFSINFLANKSLVLASGPVALLFYSGYKLNSKTMLAALDFWRFFLSAKQLSDDSRDWQEDLENNFLTLANFNIAEKINFNKQKLSIKDQDIYLNELFIKYAVPKIINDLNQLIDQAKKALKKINGDNSSLIMKNLIKPLEAAAHKSEKFLKLSGLAIHK